MFRSPQRRPVREEDAALLADFAAGDAAAAHALVARLGPMVFGLARRMLNDEAEAEDVAQEALLRLWRIAPDWDAERAQVRTWLYRVASNLCIDRLRRRRRDDPDALAELPDPAPGAERGLMAEDRRAALYAALERLPERQRSAVVLRHIEELGNPRIAEILDTSVDAVESLLARGRRRLAEDLAPRRAALDLDTVAQSARGS